MQFIYLSQIHVLIVKYQKHISLKMCLVSNADQQYVKAICIYVVSKTQDLLV